MSKNDPPVKARTARSIFFSRLWSSSPATLRATSPSTPTVRNAPKPRQPRSLKVKIITWNMHDSLPKGDLEELLGKIPSYNPANTPNNQFPTFPNDDTHPYHLVVVAGQECPTLSGIPMGLGAGFKWHDKDKNKEKPKDKEKEKPNHKEKEPAKEKEKEKEKEIEKGKEKDVERAKSRKDKDDTKKRKEEDASREHDPLGWTAMCEDWLCNGGGSGFRVSSPTVADVSAPMPLMRRAPSKEPKKGPYQLLVKERLMGIYMAIYIHRDIRALVKGTSKSAVTAGLIGGRVGNKGGVGISLNVDDTTFLFLNAHLAAHGSRINHRLANLAKIKTELMVDSFLRHDDPRMMAEDLSDRFDHTFIFGDLNFRLDITRLHADWLIAHQEYEKALHFDQLQKLMKEGKAFVGFQEEIIDFPPTFKYDVLRTLKKPKRSSSKRGQSPQAESPFHTSQEQLIHDELEEDRDGDVVSIASSVSRFSSINSGEENGETPAIVITPNPPPPLDARTPLSRAKHKTRKRWKSLLSATKLQASRSRRITAQGQLEVTTRKSMEETQRLDKSPIPTPLQRHSLDNGLPRSVEPPTILINSTKTSLNNEDQPSEKGVYDSSHKQRVPSWCDRILWKTTVIAPEDLVGDNTTRSKFHLVQVLVNAFRPRSRSVSRNFTLTKSSKEATPVFAYLRTAPASRIVPPPSQRILAHSRSQENLRGRQSSTPVLTKRGSETRLRRSNSATVDESPKPSNRGTESPNARRPPLFGFLPHFFSPTASPEASTVELVPPPPRKPRKGDVVCLSYKTLDDQGMHRLEGRSDHRPVMGSYAVYL